MLGNSHFRLVPYLGWEEKIIKLGEGLEAILLHVQATQKMEAYKQQRRWRLQKRHLKSEFSLLQT